MQQHRSQRTEKQLFRVEPEYSRECVTDALSLFPSSSCLAFSFAAGIWTGLCPRLVPVLLSQQDHGTTSLAVEQEQSIHPQHCCVTSLCWGQHYRSPDLSSCTLTVKVSNSNRAGSEPEGDMFGGNSSLAARTETVLGVTGSTTTVNIQLRNYAYRIMNRFKLEGMKCLLKTAEGSWSFRCNSHYRPLFFLQLICLFHPVSWSATFQLQPK